MSVNLAEKQTNHFGPELDKPWDAHDPAVLPPNTPEATALFGLVSTASKLVSNHGYELTEQTVRAMSGILAKVIADAQISLSGECDWANGLNMRLRGAMHTVIESTPPPLGAGEAAISQWMSETSRQIVFIANTVLAMWGRDDHTNTVGAQVFAHPPVLKNPVSSATPF